MSSTLANSTTDLEQMQELLEKKTPSYRQAYSDRTAWLMACFSELAYLRFNPMLQGQEKGWLIDRIGGLVEKIDASKLQNLIDELVYDHEKELQQLTSDVQLLGMNLLKTFDSNGTQAIIVKSGDSIVLAFRGTEATSLQDIKSDISATIVTCETGGKIHVGFKKAYEQVAVDIQQFLDSEACPPLPLFITGHSLGGALATIAAKKLRYKKSGIAACYTFGAPRVGSEVWLQGSKTPLYRLVNAADCVTMLPPGHAVISGIGWLAKFIPRVGDNCCAWLTKKYGGYYHGGDMRYLTNCKTGSYADVKLLNAVHLWRRLRGWATKQHPWKKFLADHSIGIYRKKLLVVARRRN